MKPLTSKLLLALRHDSFAMSLARPVPSGVGADRRAARIPAIRRARRSRPTYQIRCVAALVLALLTGSITESRAQTYSINWFKVAGGGGASSGGVYTVTGTVGQPDAGGPMEGGGYAVEGGFWSLYAEINTNALPAATITAPGAVCAGYTATASVSPTAGASYIWTISNGSIVSGQGSSSIGFIAGASGAVTLGVTVDNGGRFNSGTAIVPVNNPVPSFALTAPAAVCANSTGNIASVTSPLTTLLSFNHSDGGDPEAGLVQGSDGNFYGTTQGGGAIGDGTVFKITSAGTLTTLYQFSGSDGAYPYAGLVQGSDGNFYGTTQGGGAIGDGTVFKITSAGTLTTLYQFSGSDGAYPQAGLVQGSDGNFHGTTEYGGTYNAGTLFQITSAGTLTTLYSFSGPDGGRPYAGLVQGSDGNFYGTTLAGGTSTNCADGCGTVFKISPQTYSWTINGGGSITSGQGSPNVNFNAGTNTITLTATVVGSDGCPSTETTTINVYSLFPWWQFNYFGSTNAANAAPNVDVYGTGMSNTNKFLVGFSPVNPAAYLHILSVAEITNFDVNVIYLGANGDDTWSTGIASRTNVLEFTTGTASGNYSNNFASTGQTNILSGGTGLGVVTNMVDSGGATNHPSRYYRVRVLLP